MTSGMQRVVCFYVAASAARHQLHAQEIPEDTSPFYVDGFPFHALPVLHGADYTCFGYGFGSHGSRT